MDIRVEVRQAGTAPRPPAGTPVILEVRDVSLQDAPATVLASTEATVTEPDDAASPTPDVLATASLDVPEDYLTGGRDVVVWVRVAASGQARTAVGDLITMQHCAVRADAAGTPMEVPVTRIG
ncbi:MAG: hypothetical protein ACQERF_04525 [Actinomycetota bacterium]